MSDERFSWSRVDNLTGAFELKKRNIKKRLMKDSSLRCWVRACREALREGDQVYYPTTGPGPDNKVIGHVSCVDRLCAEHTAQSAADAKRQALENKSLILLPETSKRPKASKQIKVAAMRKPSLENPLAEIDRIREEIWNAGYQAGLQAALAQLSASLEKERHA
ncbi:MAG: hypothetical protein KGL39_19005 [Patescibacteria group bacterium]|nr:hypothetical protein [Patescibacteria group bacterium]